MAYGYECPLCKKVIRSNSIGSHLTAVHGYRFVIMDLYTTSEGIEVIIHKSKFEENPETLLFKRIPLRQAKQFFPEKLHNELDRWV